MTIVADFYLETPVLRTALSAAPEMSVSIEQQTVRDSTSFTLSFWASGGDFEAFETALADDPTVADVAELGAMDDRRLYQVELTDEGAGQMTYHAWAALGGMFISAERVGDRWRVRIRFPDRECLREYVESCEQQGLSFDLQQLYESGGRRDGSFGMTDRQRETLVTATEMGYFEVPRQVELEDIADVQGVSRQAVSERLRRATETLIRATVLRETSESDAEETPET